ncbi:MAG: hypothetical protein ABSD21_04775 [Rhizomicrobium sp.]|jgi:hypothetical protein
MSKRNRLVWADKVALLIVLFIAAAALLCWGIGIVGLDGRPHPRFDSAMIDWTITAELMLVPPLWLALRIMDSGARALGRWLRSGLGRVDSGGLQLPS